MSKFNYATTGKNRTTTYEGAPASYVIDSKDDLVRRALTTFINEPKFYGNPQLQTEELIVAVRKVLDQDAVFIAKLAEYTRNHLYMRSITHMLIAELAKHPKGKPYVRTVLQKVTHRPDDLTEILAYYLAVHGKPIPNSLKKGLADAFYNFNEYQLQKYNRKQNVQLKDILCLSHPKPMTKEQGDMWKRLLEDNLQTPYTWETELSAKGNTKEVWEQLIASKKVGYMALLRNLRNILKVEPDNIQDVLDYLSNPEAVKNSKQLPFRFYTAYREIKGVDSNVLFRNPSFDKPVSFETATVLEALEKAIEASVVNIETIPGKTILVNDDSNSMTWSTVSGKSTMTCAELASLFMAISHQLCEKSITSSFSSNYRMFNLRPKSGILNNTMEVFKNCQGGATYMERIFQRLVADNIIADRIIIFSDDQAHGHPHKAWLEYKKIAPNAWLHLIDLAGYGTQTLYGDNVNYIAGWSEKILQFIPLVEKGAISLVKYIETI